MIRLSAAGNGRIQQIREKNSEKECDERVARAVCEGSHNQEEKNCSQDTDGAPIDDSHACAMGCHKSRLQRLVARAVVPVSALTQRVFADTVSRLKNAS